MKRLALIVGCLLCVSLSHATYSGFSYQRIFSVLHAKVPNTDQVNFPVLISTTDVTLATLANGGHLQNASGFDLVFSTMSDCSFLLNWDTETYNASTGNLIAWVKHPLVLTASDTPIYMCYGNSGVTTYQGVSTSAWESNFKAVWHLPNGVSLSANDSTTNAINGTLTNTPTPATGQVDGSAGFASASSQYIDMGTTPTLDPAAITFSAWIKGTSFPNAYNSVVSRESGASAGSYTLLIKSTGKLAVYIRDTASTDIHYDGTGTNTLSSGVWYYIAFTYTSGGNLIGYVNGAQDASVAGSANGMAGGLSFTCYIANSSFVSRFFNGNIDEVRVASAARSADWIATEYNNQSSISTFMTMGPETQSGAAATPTSGNMPLMGL